MPSALFADLYELNMAQAYRAEGMYQSSVFEVAYRKLPDSRNYMLAAGLSGALRFLADFSFSADALTWLKKETALSESFIESLAHVQFTGDVFAVPEGTPVFPNEPLLQIVAPIIGTQLMETALLNLVHFESLALAKASRVVEAAKGRLVVDFGSRRAPGVDAALKVARTLYIAGGHGTSNLMAARQWNIPAFGTMAHSYI